jgi:hypothetical protein
MNYALNHSPGPMGLTASQMPMDPRLKVAYVGIAGIAALAGYLTYEKTDSVGLAAGAVVLGAALPVAAILFGGAMLGGAR